MTKGKYFEGLNYTLGNEDTAVEIELVKHFKSRKIFSICGSGGRSLPLITENVELLSMADLSIQQLYLAELRYKSYLQFSFEDFLKFWGYFPYSDQDHSALRKSLFNQIIVSEGCKEYFSNVFPEINFNSLLYLGKWERTFKILAKINRVILGIDFDRIMHFDNLVDQVNYYQNEFPLRRWKMVIFLLGNKSLFNALLYKGDFIEKNSPLSHFDYYFNSYDRLFTNDLASKSFFLNLCFYGRITSLNGVPVEAQSEAYFRIKNSRASIEYINEDFVTCLAKGDKQYDFLSLSDVPSYFKGDLERDFLQRIRPALSLEAIVVVRYYLRKSACDLTGFVDISESFRKLFDQEKVQMYDIHVYQYKGV
jgi:S-adenosylmethionine-diacylglycerol 3-amino-3-carboxypropyl transferase